MTTLQRLQELFRELFQLDLADLDFGIYRLLRLKRDEVEAFLTEQLPRRVREVFAGLAEDEVAELQHSVAELQGRIRAEVSEDAILSDGEIAPRFRDNPAKAVRDLLDEYRSARKRLVAVHVTEAQQAEVFNHLYTFFSRYYESGDFIPRRRYGAREAYAIPYNGEETFFHWANRDQHYVKTAEAFRDYAFTVDALGGPFRVRFVLTQASVPPGNTKGDTRYFFPQPDEMDWDATTKTLRVTFHYRVATDREIETYGKNAPLQDGILEDAVPKVLERVPEPVLKESLAGVVHRRDDKDITLLSRRLQHFAKKNTSDYFVHRNLRAFLRREMEFFIRDQVVHEADLDGDFRTKQRALHVLRELADTVISFLASVEDTQKQLFEKKKIVLGTHYLAPIQEVPPELWPEVLANEAQLSEWRELFALDLKEPVSKDAFENYPTLVVDTRHFSPHFTARLLEAIDDLDERMDGVLFHSENRQALSLMQARYREKVKCIYIDPPYNSKTTEIIYKNNYKHSSWLALMEGRLRLSRRLATRDGSHVVAVDENEQERLGQLLSILFPDHRKVCVVILHNKKGIQGDYFSYSHDYAFFCIGPELAATNGIPIPESEWDFDNLRKWGRESERETARNCFYPIFVKDKTIVGFGEVCPDDFHPRRPNLIQGDQVAVYPVDSQGVERKWRYSRESVERILPLLKIHVVTGSGEVQIHKAKAERTIKTVWDDPRYIAGDYGTKWLTNLGLKISESIYPKSVHTVEDSIFAVSDTDSLILDYFAGTGTTAHAVINLNRKDAGRRKFILVEVGDYFDTVLVPRIKKVMFTAEWKEGKPQRAPLKDEASRTPRLVKVLRLESYEDALHNVSAEDTAMRAGDRTQAYFGAVGPDQYRLRYLVRLSLESSASMLQLDRLERPFDYTIEVLTEDGPKRERADLVETFNFLYGIHVQRLATWTNQEDADRRYCAVKGTTRDNRRVLVLWRDMTNLDPAVERRFLEPKIEVEGPFDEMLINGDCAVPGVQSLDGIFKQLMEEGET